MVTSDKDGREEETVAFSSGQPQPLDIAEVPVQYAAAISLICKPTPRSEPTG